MGGEELQTKSVAFQFSELQARLGAAKAVEDALALRLGDQFNVFDWISPNEVRFSSILRDFLDPCGSHGQGERFLAAFLQVLGLDDPRWSERLASARVQTEVPTNENRRIDILINFGGEHVIAIENKPWAVEQDRQLDDYAAFLVGKYGDQGTHLVFLAGDGIQASTLNDYARLRDDGRFHELPLRGPAPSLQSWMNDCARVAEADKIRSFLSDWADWVGTAV
jgi:hypothetical protein